MIKNFDNTYKLKVFGTCFGKYKQVLPLKDENTIFLLLGDNNIGKLSFENDLEKLFGLEYQLSQNNNYLVIIRGALDNSKYFKKKSSFKEELADNAEHIILLPDYSIIHIGDNNILCVGGGTPLDRSFKIKNYNYWTLENVKSPDRYFYKNIVENNENINTIVSYEPYIKDIDKCKKISLYSLYDKTLKHEIDKDQSILFELYKNLNEIHPIEKWIYNNNYNVKTAIDDINFIGLNNEKYVII